MKKQRVLDLRPTQFAIGMLEIDEKIKAVKKMRGKKRRAYFDETTIPVVISPHEELYIVDHHHFLFVAHLFGIRKVRVKVVKDLSASKMSFQKFWEYMNKHRSVYPFCQFGEGPRNEIYLPRDIRGLADDPYRSIAWFVRKAGAFENSEKNFAEFQWANFFRKRGLLDKHGLRGLKEALDKAVKLAQSPAAKRLPGYGKLNLEAKVEVKKKIRKAKEAIADHHG